MTEDEETELLDKFAGLALNALIQDMPEKAPGDIAKRAYEYATAMLLERRKVI